MTATEETTEKLSQLNISDQKEKRHRKPREKKEKKDREKGGERGKSEKEKKMRDRKSKEQKPKDKEESKGDGKEEKKKKKLRKKRSKKRSIDIESPTDEKVWVEVPEGFDVSKRTTLAMLLPQDDGTMKLVPIEDRGPSGSDESDVDTISTSSDD